MSVVHTKIPHDSSSWKQIYVYARNARFFPKEDNDKSNSNNSCARGLSTQYETSASTGGGSEEIQIRVPAPTVDEAVHPGVKRVIGCAGPGVPAALKDAELAVIFFWATWCTNSEKFLPALLALAGRYQDEGTLCSFFSFFFVVVSLFFRQWRLCPMITFGTTVEQQYLFYKDVD